MEGLSGHFSLREGFTPHGGSTAAVAVSPSSSDHWEQSSHHSTNFHGVVGGQGGNNGYSSPSYSIDLDYNTNNQHHHSNHHHHQQQPPLARGGSMGRLSNGGHFGLSQHVHHHPSIVIDNNNISRQQGQPHENQQQLSSILPRQDSYTSIGDVGVPGNPARLGMSVQDLKHMTAMRMAQQQHTGAGSPDVGAQGSRSQPSTPNDVAQNQRRATGGLVSHGQSNHDAVGLTSRAQQGNPQLLNQHREQMELREQQAAMSSPSLSRHSSAKSMSSFQPQQQHPQASVGGGRPPQLVVGHQTRAQEPGVLIMAEQHVPQRAIHRGASAPRLYPSPPMEDLASNPNGRLFTHGLSVEELKEMTKLRLQHQQGGRSSPKTGISGPGSAMIGDGRGGVGHECVEWRQSAVGDKLHRGGLVVGDEPLPNAVGLVRRSTSIPHVVPHAGMPRDTVVASTVGGRRAFSGVGVGRMEVSMLLEDRMRVMQSEVQTASPRILSQPSSPCFSQPGSPTSSMGGNSPRRNGRHFGGYIGPAGAPPPGFAGNGGGRGIGGGGDNVFVHHVVGSSGFSSAPGVPGGVDRGRLNVVRPMRSASVGGLGGFLRHGNASPHLAGGSGPAGRGSPAIMVDDLDNSRYGGRSMAERSARARSFDGRVASAFGPSSTVACLAVGSRGGLSVSLSPPSGENRPADGNGGRGVYMQQVHQASFAPGSQLSFNRTRRSSYDEGTTASSAGRNSASPPPLQHGVWGEDTGHGDVSSHQHEQHNHRPRSLDLVVGENLDRLRSVSNSAATLHGQRPSSLGRSSAVGFERMSIAPRQSAPAANAGGRTGGSSAVMDVIASQCAEFALLTPKGSAIAARQSGVPASPLMKMWSSQSGGGGDSLGPERMPSGNANAPSNGDPVSRHGGTNYMGSDRADDCQVSSRSGSPADSPQHAGDVDDNGESSCGSGSGGGTRQGSVRAAFGALDAAVGRGGGGGAEACGSFDGSFPLGSDGSTARNAGGHVKGQRFGGPVASGAFFGEDLPDCAGMSLEGVEEGADRSSPPSAPNTGRRDSPGSSSMFSTSSQSTSTNAHSQQRNNSVSPPGFSTRDGGGDYGYVGGCSVNRSINSNGVIGPSRRNNLGQTDQSNPHLEFCRDGEARNGSRGGSPGSGRGSANASPPLSPNFVAHHNNLAGGSSEASPASALHNKTSF